MADHQTIQSEAGTHSQIMLMNLQIWVTNSFVDRLPSHIIDVVAGIAELLNFQRYVK